MILTESAFASVAPQGRVAYPYLAEAAASFGIEKADEVCHWLAQMAHESAGFTKTKESLNYSVNALLATFGRHRISEDGARKYGRDKNPADQVAIANCIYGGKWGRENLGNTEPGDGARFIGRGFKQLTGRDNYSRCSHAVYGDQRLIESPELLEKPEGAGLSAGWFWRTKGLQRLALADDIEAITKVINGGHLGLAERKAWLAKFRAAL